jgi:hypothetical protein
MAAAEITTNELVARHLDVLTEHELDELVDLVSAAHRIALES